MVGIDDNVAAAIADALWDGVRHEPPLPVASAGWRRWYLSHVYAPVVDHRRRRVWTHRSPQPWLGFQWALTRAGGTAVSMDDLRWEGLPGGHSYEPAYRAVREGRFTPPFVFVAGYSRSGTTSVQNVVMAGFPEHLPPGSWSDPDHPLRLWWFPKHKAETAARLAALPSDASRVLVTVRPVTQALASHAIYRGYWHPYDLPPSWISEEAGQWQRITEVALTSGVVAVDFRSLCEMAPLDVGCVLAGAMGLSSPESRLADLTWATLSENGISPDVVDDPQLSNIPNPERVAAMRELVDHIGTQLNARLQELDALCAEAAARAATWTTPVPPEVDGRLASGGGEAG